MHAEEYAGEVDRDHAIPFGHVGFADGREADDAGVVDQNVDAAKGFVHLGYDRCPVGFIGNVEMKCLAAHFGGYGRCLIIENIGDRDGGTFAGQDAGELRAHAAGPTGDDGNLSVKLAHRLLLISGRCSVAAPARWPSLLPRGRRNHSR